MPVLLPFPWNRRNFQGVAKLLSQDGVVASAALGKGQYCWYFQELEPRFLDWGEVVLI